MDPVSDTLQALREIPGVAAVLLIDAFGEILARSSASFVADEDLPAVAQKIALISEAAHENLENADDMVLSYEGYSLTLKRNPFGVLATLADHSVNPEALRMGASVVLRRLTMMGGPQNVPAEPAPSRGNTGAGRVSTQGGRIPTQGGKVPTQGGRIATQGGRVPTQGERPGPNSTGAQRKTGAQKPVTTQTKRGEEAPKPKKKNDIWG
jgi:predicted regulator of Ras-like GTPase activity (Roadblock/LC7/MglB family)